MVNFMLGFLSMLAIYIWVRNMDQKYLIEKAESRHRTPVLIKKRFYYIVPEAEYVELDQLRRKRREE